MSRLLTTLKGSRGIPTGGLVAAWDFTGMSGDTQLIPGVLGTWQARRNLLNYSEPLLANLPTKSAAITQASFTEAGLTNGMQFPAASQLDFAYSGYTLTPNQTHVFSVYVAMDDGSVPRPGASGLANADFDLIIGGANIGGTQPYTVEHVLGNVYRVSSRFTSASWSLASSGVARYAPQSGKAFRVTGYQLETGTTPSAYQRTTTTEPTLAQRGATTGAEASDPALSMQGLVFDGTDDVVNVQAQTAITAAGRWTMIAVFSHQAGTTGGIVNFSQGSLDRCGIRIEAGVLAGGYYNGSYTGKLFGTPLASGWSCVSVVNAAGTVSGWVNNLPMSLSAMSLLSTGNTLGHNTNAGSHNGTIAAVLIYNRALTDAEIKATHKALKERLAPYGVTLA